MIAYIDSTVLLRVVLQQPDRLREWGTLEGGVSSKLLRVECHRALDRLWHTNVLDDVTLETKRRAAEAFLRVISLRDVDENVLDLATEPLATSLGTIDALHLTTAMIHRAEQIDARQIVFATHDPTLATAARAMHFEVIGA